MLRRTKLITSFFLICILTLSVGCGSKTAEVLSRPLNTDQTASILTYKLPNMEKLNVKKDIIYEDYNKLKLDIYYPPGHRDISKTPTVVLVHGIADDTNLKDSEIFKAWGKVIAASGFTAVIFNWRPSLNMSQDVSDLMRYIRDNGDKLNINRENICVFAFSAGVLKGVTDAMKVNTGFIKKVVVYYGQLDEIILTMQTNIKLPSFFIAMGSSDQLYPTDSNDSFISQAKAAGCNVINEVQPMGGHGFDITNNDEHTKKIIDKTLEFIDDSGNP